jgi:hypothetical protein
MQATLIKTEKNPRLKIRVIRVPSFYRTLISRMQATLVNTNKKNPRLKIRAIRVPSFYRTLLSRMQATPINTEKKIRA